MVDQGKHALQGSLDQIKKQQQLLNARFVAARDKLPQIDGILSAERRGNSWCMVCNGATQQVHNSLQTIGGEVTHSRNASL